MAADVELRARTAVMTDHEVWRCAREEIPVHRSVVIELHAEGHSGWAEVPAYLTGSFNSDVTTTWSMIELARPQLDGHDPRAPHDLLSRVAATLKGTPFLAAALETAAFDLAARLAGLPLYAYLGLPDPSGRRSSFSIGLDTPAVMRDKLARCPHWPQYKVKLASPRDLDVLRGLREVSNAPFWVDGNASWTPQDLLPSLDALAGLGVTAIEQPYLPGAVDAQRELLAQSPVPVFADESVSCEDDLDEALAHFDGINVKVLKAGGIGPALRMLHKARAAGRQSMLGCVPESSAGASAAAHLAAAADHVDLDTIALLACDTGQGITLGERGEIELAPRPGSGFEPDWSATVWCEEQDGPPTGRAGS